MTTSTHEQWQEANTRYLMARWLGVRETLLGLGNTGEPSDGVAKDEASGREDFEADAASIAAGMAVAPALDQLCAEFGLSPFERDLLLLCAGVELDSDFADLCSQNTQRPQLPSPTFGLALANLPGGYWAAIAPASPLRYWRLLEVGRGETLASSPLRIDERVLHYLVGISYLDERLANFFQIVPQPASLPASYRPLAEQIAGLWFGDADERPIIQLTGNWQGGKRKLAAAGCAALGLRLHSLNAADIPATSVERETLLRLWQRESLLLRTALLLDVDEADPASLRLARTLARQIGGLLFISGELSVDSTGQSVVTIPINRPGADEQRALWEAALGPIAARLNGQLDEVVSQFQFDPESIGNVGRAVREHMTAEPVEIDKILWRECRVQSRASLDGLAECIETRARWEDLILPLEQLQTLGELAAQVRQRMKVYESWGFAARSPRGLGITALFAGPSGTGKTLAAEVVANDLQLDLHRIDLSQVVSKYIGETEKNLRAVFNAAEHSGAVLLFDEADALFGKRSEVRDSHDRYANIEVSYLLQRMEAYRGLAILTTNRRGSLDGAFMRRLRFLINFPFPDANLRAKIWSRIFPLETPTVNLDVDKLARLSVAGGNIRNIALNAAFLAADLHDPVTMGHLLRTAHSECSKIEKQITAAEIGGWA
ncbi:MAG: ATPase central protein [Acidobacteria bacterium]|nr:ATPase central protein [Acidobacteriota bacterium]